MRSISCTPSLLWSVLALLVLSPAFVGCGDKDGGSGNSPEESDADADSDADSDADADADSDADADADSDADSDADADTDPTEEDVDGDGVIAADDCNDADATVYPGATELWCDGIDQDCDSADLTGSWLTAAGVDPVDVTATLVAGTVDSPAYVSVEDGGSLQLCGGDYYAQLYLNGTTTVEGKEGVILRPGRGYGIYAGTSSISSVSGIRIEGGVVGVETNPEAELELNDVEIVGATTGIQCRYGCLASLTDTDISGATAAAIWSNAGEFNLDGGTISDSASPSYGTVSIFAGSLDVQDTTFSGNTSQYGAIFVTQAPATIEGASFIDNHATAYGGGLVLSVVTSATVSNSLFSGNSADGSGGGIYVAASTGVVLDGLTLTDNSVLDHGAGLLTNTSTVTLSNSSFGGNVAGYSGGAALLNGETSLSGTTFEDNVAYYGGILTLEAGSLSQSGGSFSRNSSTYSGGMVGFGCGMDVTLTSVTMGSGADVNVADGVYDASGDLFSGSTLDLACVNGECSGGATDLCNASGPTKGSH